MKQPSKASSKAAPESGDDPRFAALVRALAEDPRFVAVIDAYVAGKTGTSSGRGKKFGSNALKVEGRIFAMMSSKGAFVVKLPRERVDAIVASQAGDYFDPGHGRLMKEWVAIASSDSSWVELAKEAHDFVKRARR